MSSSESEALEGIVDVQGLRTLSNWCGYLGCDPYAKLLAGLAATIDNEKASSSLMRLLEVAVRSCGEYWPLSLLAAVHARVLSGQAPGLASYYPSVGGTSADYSAATDQFISLCNEEPDALMTHAQRVPQTNDVRRCIPLAAGYMYAGAHASLPLRILEVGASAGLNLLWDQYYYDFGTFQWGSPASEVRLRAGWEGNRNVWAESVTVLERLGCDVCPVDVFNEDGWLRLRSYVWPNDLSRLNSLDAAVAVRRLDNGVVVENGSASSWLAAQLQEPRPGLATVVVHSAVTPYLSESERVEMTRAIDATGALASVDAPLIHLSFEDRPDRPAIAELRATMYPGGKDLLLATVHRGHESVRWLM